MKISLLAALRRGVPAFLLGSSCLIGSGASAWAQGAPEGQSGTGAVAEADRLFKQAAAHMDRREYEAACPLLERSHALDPSGGTLLNLGDCYEQRGSTASAYRAFEEARELSIRTGRTDRAEVAELRKKQLFPILRRLTITLANPGPESLVVHVNGKPLARSSWNVPVPVDPGEHEVRVSAHGHADHTATVSAPLPGGTVSVPIPALKPYTQPASPDAPSRKGENALDGQEVAAIAFGVVGVAGVATGTVFGLRSRSKHEESNRFCTGNTCADRRGVELMNDARRAGNVSTVSFIAGGVGLGAAAVLWFVRPFGGEAVRAEIGFGPAEIRVRGRW